MVSFACTSGTPANTGKSLVNNHNLHAVATGAHARAALYGRRKHESRVIRH